MNCQPSIAGVLPPFSLEAEGVTLCQFLTLAGDDTRDKPERRQLDATAEMLRPEHFHAECNQRIWQAIEAARSAGKTPSVVGVNDWLRSHGYAGMAPPEYVHELAGVWPYSMKVREQAEIIVGKWRLRRLIATCQKVAGAAYGATGDVDTFLVAAEAELLSSTAAEGDAEPIPSMADAIVEEADRILRSDGRVTTGLWTGLADVDRIAGPMEPGDFVMIGAHSGVGKSSLGMQIAMNVVSFQRLEDKPVDVYVASQEMTRMQLGRRALGIAIGADTRAIAMGRLGENELSKVAEVVESIRTQGTALVGLRVDDRPAVKPSQLRSRARQIQRESARAGSRLGMIVVDYLQLMDGSEGTKRSNERHEREIAFIAESLKNIAKSLGVVVIALGQLNDASRREGRLPRGEDMFGCTQVRSAADKFYLINNESAMARRQQERSEDEDKGELPPETVQILVDKNRGGTEAIAVTKFHPSRSLFVDLSPDERRAYYAHRKAAQQDRLAEQQDRKTRWAARKGAPRPPQT